RTSPGSRWRRAASRTTGRCRTYWWTGGCPWRPSPPTPRRRSTWCATTCPKGHRARGRRWAPDGFGPRPRRVRVRDRPTSDRGGAMSAQLRGKRVAVMVANEGVEQVELTRPWDALVEAGAEPVPSVRTDIVNAGGEWVDREVVVDDSGPNTIVSSRKPDDLPAFCDAMVDAFAKVPSAA